MKQILFVDDEFCELDKGRRVLEGERGRWETAFELGGELALERCERTRFDLVIADLRMPGMDGGTLLGHVRDRFPDAARMVLADPADLPAAARAASDAHRLVSKPCNPAELVLSIERVFALQDLFSSPEIRKTIGHIGGLPSPSSTYHALQLSARDPDASLAGVARIVERDVAMSAKVLQLVNSGLFGLAQTIRSVSMAVSYLGTETIKNLALHSETFRAFAPDPCIPKGFLEAVQRRAQRAAVVAAALPLSIRDRDTVILAALLHDIGQLVLASRMPLPFSAALKLARERACPLFETEEALFGISHAELGAYLLGMWGINGAVVEAVAHHLRPERIPHSGFDSSAATYVAVLLEREMEADPRDEKGTELRPHDRRCLDSLGLLQQYSALRSRACAAIDREEKLSAR